MHIIPPNPFERKDARVYAFGVLRALPSIGLELDSRRSGSAKTVNLMPQGPLGPSSLTAFFSPLLDTVAILPYPELVRPV